jgi:threonine/homoserine/homoserine lactone efflux protein
MAGEVGPAAALNEGFQAALLVAAGIVAVAVLLTALVAQGSRPARVQSQPGTGAIPAPDHI